MKDEQVARNVKAVEVAGVAPMPEEGIRTLSCLDLCGLCHDANTVSAHK